MVEDYKIALMGVTGTTVQTQFTRFDERWNVPMIAEADRYELYKSWLQSVEAPNEEQWTVIKGRWISFLSATSTRPSTDLAPNRNAILTTSKRPATSATDTKRFERDCRVRSSIQASVYLAFDRSEAYAERWPPQARLILNRACCPTATEPFQTLRAKPDLGKRRRYQSVWASLVSFLVYCYDNFNGVKDMGLQPRELLEASILQVLDSIKSGIMSKEEIAVEDLCNNMLIGFQPTAVKNPLLWWMAVLVRSAIDPPQDSDYISRGRFLMNILPIDLDLASRFQAIQHYAKVFALDYVLDILIQYSGAQVAEILDDLSSQNMDWLEDDMAQRPSGTECPRNCGSPAWKDILGDLNRWAMAFLSARKDVDTVGGEINKLLSIGSS